MSRVLGVVLAHADMARALVDTVARISGESDALVAVSNEGLGPEQLRQRVVEAAGDGPTLIFADLASGSCALAGRLAARGDGARVVLTGVNLPILLDFVFHRELPLPELARRLEERGRAAIGAHFPEEAGVADRPCP